MKMRRASRKTQPARARTRRRTGLRARAARFLALAVALAAFAPAPLVRAAGGGDDGETLTSSEEQGARALAVRFVGRVQEGGGAMQLTPEEEREARELVESFHRRFKETHDIAPEIPDHFVPDFAARLRQDADTLPFAFIRWKDESERADPDELQRFYVATTNFLSLFFRYFAAARQKRVAEGVHEDPPLKEVLPPEALKLVKSDPIMLELWPEDEEEGSRQDAAEAGPVDAEGKDVSVDAEEKAAAEKPHEEEEQLIANAEQLRSFTLLNEKLSKLLRAHLASHPLERTGAVGSRGVGDDAGEDEEGGDDDIDPDKVEVHENARVVGEEFYGYPHGTRLVCAQAGFFHVEMVPVWGRLRILSVYLLIED